MKLQVFKLPGWCTAAWAPVFLFARRAPFGDTRWGGEVGEPAWPCSHGGEKSTPGGKRNTGGLSCQGHSRPRGWGLRPPRARTPTRGVQMTAPPTAGVPGKNPRAGCMCIHLGSHCRLPGAPEPPQGCSAPSSASAGVY